MAVTSNIPPNTLAAVADFRLALQGFEHISDRIVRRCGLTPRQHLLLLVLEGKHGGSASIGTLASELLLAQSTTTELVDRSEASGLVERRTSADDARVALVCATAEGRLRLTRAFDALEHEREALSASIDELRHAVAGASRRPH